MKIGLGLGDLEYRDVLRGQSGALRGELRVRGKIGWVGGR
jgi:hypothetical protein